MTEKGTIIGPGAFLQGGDKRHVIAIIDLDDAEPTPRLIDIDFLGHGVSIDPSRPFEAAVFEKKGPGACQVDLKSGTKLRTIETKPNRHFYGHGAYSADGALLYATESVLDDDHRGVLIVRDAKTFEELGELPTYGQAPHDCMLLPDGRTMVVANGGGPINRGAMPNVTYIDIKSEVLVDRVELTEKMFNAGHLALTTTGDLAIVSAPRDGLPKPHQQRGAITLVPKGKSAQTIKRPSGVTDRMLGETLSVAIYEPESVVMATHPDGNMVSMWKMDGSLVGTLDQLTEPRGVALTLDHKCFVISHRTASSVVLTLVPADTRVPDLEHQIAPSFTSGSHIFVHDLRAA